MWSCILLLLIATITNLLIDGARRHCRLIAPIPECCIQVIFGLVVGLIVHFTSSTVEQTLLSFFTPNAFFSFILPPILIEAGYFMPRRDFAVNIVSILTFAVFGTIINCFMLAGALYGVGLVNLSPQLPFLELLMYCAIISAVDPVAVMAVFQELNVNMSLYIVEFGESLLNDGVSLVLYQIFRAMLQTDQLSTQLLGWLGPLKFLWIMAAGTIVGFCCGFVGAWLLRVTPRQYSQLQPFLAYGICYFAYTSCNLLSISSIFGVIACAFFMRPYADHNLTPQNRVNLDTTIKLAAHIAEMMVFVFLGVVTVAVFFEHSDTFDLNFTLWNVLFVTIIRFFVVFGLGLCLNQFTTRTLLWVLAFLSRLLEQTSLFKYNTHFTVICRFDNYRLQWTPWRNCLWHDLLAQPFKSHVLCTDYIGRYILHDFRAGQLDSVFAKVAQD